MSRVWIIDDEPSICSALSRAIQRMGHETQIFSAAEPALALVKKSSLIPDLILLDIRLPGMDGLTATARLQKAFSNVPIIIMTAFGDLTTAVRAIESQVFEYLTKPFDLSTAQTAIRRALESRALESRALEGHASSLPSFSQAARLEATEECSLTLVGSSPIMQTVFKRIAVAAANNCPVLIFGEKGSGKQLIARSIHANSPLKDKPYLTIAPASLEPSLIESKLYGVADSRIGVSDDSNRGILELAANGTMVIDEVGDLPLAQQAKLLRVLEHREFIPVGGTRHRPFQARLLATTQRNLLQSVADGSFREDLYFRLAVFTIEVPPLREKTTDIIPLATSFLLRHGYDLRPDNLDSSTIDILLQHRWPGNVSELRNVIDHAAIHARGQRIHPEHLPELRQHSVFMASNQTKSEQALDISQQLDRLIRLWLQEQNTAISNSMIEDTDDDPSQRTPDEAGMIYDAFLSVVEPSLIRGLLEAAQGNRAAVAHALGLHRSTLRQKMRRHKMET